MANDEITVLGLRVLRRVSETGSFAAAADDLGYSQSAISRQVAALEKAVGAVLFERGRRGVEPTAAGEVLLGTARKVLAELDGTSHRLAAVRDRLAGRLAAGAFPSAAAVLLPRAVAAVLADHPALDVTIDEAPTPTLLRQVRSGRLDVAVVAVLDADEHDLDGLTSQRLPAVGLRVAVPASHPLALRDRVRPSELERERWVVGKGDAGDAQFGPWPTLIDPVVAFAVRSWPARLGLVAAGLGVCVIPGAAAESVPAGVVVLEVDDPARRGRVGTVVTREGAASAAADLLVRSLRREAENLSTSRR